MKKLAIILGVVIVICTVVFVSITFYFTDRTIPKKPAEDPPAEDPPAEEVEEVTDVPHEEIKTDGSQNPGM